MDILFDLLSSTKDFVPSVRGETALRGRAVRRFDPVRRQGAGNRGHERDPPLGFLLAVRRNLRGPWQGGSRFRGGIPSTDGAVPRDGSTIQPGVFSPSLVVARGAQGRHPSGVVTRGDGGYADNRLRPTLWNCVGKCVYGKTRERNRKDRGRCEPSGESRTDRTGNEKPHPRVPVFPGESRHRLPPGRQYIGPCRSRKGAFHREGEWVFPLRQLDSLIHDPPLRESPGGMG